MNGSVALVIPGLGLIGWATVASRRGYVNFSKRLDSDYAIWREHQPAAFLASIVALLLAGCIILYGALR